MGLRLKGIRLRVDKGLGRICSVCSALGLEPAFRRGLGLGVGFEVQVEVNQNRSTCYVIGNTACEGLACDQTIPWGGGAGNARRLTMYTHMWLGGISGVYVCVGMCVYIYMYTSYIYMDIYIYIHTQIH